MADLVLKNGLKASVRLFSAKIPRLCVTACYLVGTPMAVQDGYKNIENIVASELSWLKPVLKKPGTPRCGSPDGLSVAADALSQEAQYKYRNGLLEQETFKNGLCFYFRYDGAGPEARCIRTWGDEGIYDHKLYYDVANRRTTVANSLGHEATYIGNENGLVVQYIDRRGGLHQTEYNAYNEVLSETDPLGNTTQYQYNERGNCVETQMSAAKTVRMFDENDQLTQLTDVMGNTWQWVYDAKGNLLERLGSTGLVTRYAYQNGLLGTVVEPTGRVIALRYDAGYNLQEVLDGKGIGSRALYDGWGRLRKATDERGNVQWCEHDLLNRVVQVHEPDGNVRSFAYDGLNNVIRIKDRQQEVQYVYRGMGSMVRRVEAGTAVEFAYDTEEQLRAVVNEHGLFYRFMLDAEGDVLVETGFDGLTREYVRDIGGRVAELVRPSNRRTYYTYSPTGQVEEVHYSDGSSETYRFAPNGAMLEAHNDAASVSMVRDSLGRIVTESQNAYVVESQYDAFGNRISLQSSLGAQVSYQHSEAGDVEQMRAGSWQALFERDAQGLEMQRLLSGGVRMQWKRNALGRPIEQRISTSSRREIRQRYYSWQTSDQLTQIADSSTGLTQFTHDAVGNLAATHYANGTQQLRLPDAVGNLFTTPQRQDRRYGPAGQLLEANGTQYFYDAEGNLARKLTPTGQEWHYSWSEAGRLSSVLRPDGQVVRFTYDALGRRLSKHYRGQVTRWVWDGNVPLHEWTGLELEQANVEEVITWLFEEDSFTPLAKLQGAQHYSLVSDHLGTPLELHGAGDAPVWAAELDSYGRVRHQQGDVAACPFRYQGQYEDQETGLYYNRFRYYDPESGQYISQDPIGLLSNNPTAYAYVVDPKYFVDPSGLYNGEGVRDLGDYVSFHNHNLSTSEYTKPDKYHFAKANEAVYNRIQTDPAFKQYLETNYPGAVKHVSPTRNGTFRGTAPKNLTWHHATASQMGGQPGWLQMVDRADHSTYHKIYHPDDIGGRNEWGGGTSCRK